MAKKSVSPAAAPAAPAARRGPFPYSGNKQKLLDLLPRPPRGSQVCLEPFAGSLAYGLHWRLPAGLRAAEVNGDMRALWHWLATRALPEDLRALAARQPKEKMDVRALGLDVGPQTLLRLFTSGAYVGQLSSWQLWPKNNMNPENLIAMLPVIRDQLARGGPVLARDYRDLVAEGWDDRPGTLWFIDPPYMGTKGNYSDKTTKKNLDRDGVDIDEVREFIRGLKSPAIITYGDGAHVDLPGLDWRLLAQRSVPILRGGGSKLRNEYAAVVNWPSEDLSTCWPPVPSAPKASGKRAKTTAAPRAPRAETAAEAGVPAAPRSPTTTMTAAAAAARQESPFAAMLRRPKK